MNVEPRGSSPEQAKRLVASSFANLCPNVALLLCVLVVWTAPSAAGQVHFPGAHWESRAPELFGLDGLKLNRLAENLGGRGCVVSHGYVVTSWGSQSQAGDWLSSAKPVLSTLLLFAVAEGKLAGVDTAIEEYGWRLKPKDRTLTFRHLANMISGYARPDAPGAAWAYNDYAIQLYQQTLFDKVFREAPEKVAMDGRRFGFLRLEDGLAFRTKNRRMSASVRDFARIAWFWFNKGNWDGTQLLPAKFFEEFQRPQVPAGLPHTVKAETDDYLGIGSFGGGSDHFTEFGAGIYGFNWWFNGAGRLHRDSLTWPDAPADTFMSIGAGGNCAVMIPSLNLVLVSARGNWGELQAGEAGALMNQHLKLLVEAGSPEHGGGP